jgi:predicted patatin/cPLA2 family phospholipase
MIGLIDIGGGMRGVYTSGVYDYLLDNDVKIDYCIGVSSGSGNLLNFVAKQRGRNRKFYTDYSFDKDYFGPLSVLKTGNLINLNYIYSEVSDSTGKDPIDYETFMANECKFTCVSTNAKTAEPCYFTKEDFGQDNYTALKAACALPAACRPVRFRGKKYFDGGVSDPIPIKKAFADGCDKVIVCITQPRDFRKTKIHWLANIVLANHPPILKNILVMHHMYNNGIEELLELERQGKVLVVDPEFCFGVDTIKRDKEGMQKLYELGYRDGKKIEDFVNQARAELNK